MQILTNDCWLVPTRAAAVVKSSIKKESGAVAPGDVSDTSIPQ